MTGSTAKPQTAADQSADAAISEGVFDLVVIGAGINGAGIARDAAARGLKVAH